MIPTLIATPMTVFNARALASLVTVAGNAPSKRLTVILSALIKVLEEEKDEDCWLLWTKRCVRYLDRSRIQKG